MKKSLKQKNKKSNEEIEKLKNQLKKMERATKETFSNQTAHRCYYVQYRDLRTALSADRSVLVRSAYQLVRIGPRTNWF